MRQLSWIQKLRRDGCLPLQTLGFFTGAALTVIACLTFAAKLLDLNVGALRARALFLYLYRPMDARWSGSGPGGSID